MSKFYLNNKQAFINYNFLYMDSDVGNCARKRAVVHVTNDNMMW